MPATIITVRNHVISEQSPDETTKRFEDSDQTCV